MENTIIQSGSAYLFSYCSTVENNLSETICDGDSILLGGQYQFSSGTYYDTLLASTGCDSVVITDLTVMVIDTTVTLVGATLTAEETDATYQWIDCSTSQIIPGESDKSYTFSSAGSYAVEITSNGCIDTSNCHVINVLGIPENAFGTNISVYPNPANQFVNIDLGRVYNDLDAQIVNVTGNIVLHKHFEKQRNVQLDLGSLSNGLYFIQLRTNKKNAFIRVVKNR